MTCKKALTRLKMALIKKNCYKREKLHWKIIIFFILIMEGDQTKIMTVNKCPSSEDLAYT